MAFFRPSKGKPNQEETTRAEPSPMAQPTPTVRKKHPVKVLLGDLRGTRKLSKKNHLNLLSAGVAFFCVFSLCPFFIICFVGSQYLLAHIGVRNASSDMNVFFGALFPNLDPNLAQTFNDILHANALSNTLSIVLLCWSTYELFVCLQTVFSKMSTKGGERNFLFSNLMSVVCFLVVFGACTLFLLLSTTNAETLQSLIGPYVDGVSLRMVRYLAYLISLAGVIVSITSIYKLMPTQKIKIRNAFRASVLFVTIFLAGRVTYQMYVSFFKMMNGNVYGALLHFLVVLIWIYFLSSAFLFSAQYAIYLEDKV